ncbi:hypothetical protein [Priestia koreensis]|uniref:hypothetical protein n=1 Tax=Priestia koreensis TaxID=284581 RepID=UPI001F58FA2F|nr:hypothetical protein [Priestia koreensis]UNL87572.1 hypothetical protein IE339_24020 [Priestia koreensis]
MDKAKWLDVNLCSLSNNTLYNLKENLHTEIVAMEEEYLAHFEGDKKTLKTQVSLYLKVLMCEIESLARVITLIDRVDQRKVRFHEDALSGLANEHLKLNESIKEVKENLAQLRREIDGNDDQLESLFDRYRAKVKLYSQCKVIYQARFHDHVGFAG